MPKDKISLELQNLLLNTSPDHRLRVIIATTREADLQPLIGGGVVAPSGQTSGDINAVGPYRGCRGVAHRDSIVFRLDARTSGKDGGRRGDPAEEEDA